MYKGFGGTMTQMTSVGLGGLRGFSKLSSMEQSVLRGIYQDLKPPRFSDDGRILQGDILLPSWFGNKIPLLKNPDGSINQDKVRAFFAENPELSQVITYRIPGQAKFSIDSARVVGLLPDSMGDSIVMFDEMPAKTGADFDIDKMFLILPEFRIDRKGRVKFVEYVEGNSKKAKITRYMRYIEDTLYTENRSLWRRFNGIGVERSQEKLGTINDLVDKGIVVSFKEFTQPVTNGGQWSIERQNGTAAITNRIINLYHSLLSHPEVFVQNITPITGIDFDKVVADIKRLKGETEVAFADWIGFGHQIELHEEYTGAKSLVAIVANHIAYHAMMEDSGISINGLTFNANQDTEGNPVVDVLSAVLNAAVDAINNNQLPFLGMTRHTANVGLSLLRLDVPYERVFKFLAQPIIVDLANQRDIDKSSISLEEFGIPEDPDRIVRSTDKVIRKYSRDRVITETPRKYAGRMPKNIREDGGVVWDEYREARAQEFDAIRKAEQKEIIKRNKETKAFKQVDDPFAFFQKNITLERLNKGLQEDKDSDFYSDQFSILRVFLALEEVAQNLGSVMKLLRVDTQGMGKSPADLLAHHHLRRSLEENPNIEGLVDFEFRLNHMISTILFNAQNFGATIGQQLFIELQPNFMNTLTAVSKVVGNHNPANADFIQKVLDSTYAYQAMALLHSIKGLSNERLMNMVYGDNTMVRRLIAITEKQTEKNEFLRWLMYYVHTTGQEFIRATQAVSDPQNESMLIASFNELLLSENKEVADFAEDLIWYSVLTSGMSQGTSTIQHVVLASPLAQKRYKLKEFLKELKDTIEGNEGLLPDVAQILLHNSYDSQFVPQFSNNKARKFLPKRQGKRILNLKKSGAAGLVAGEHEESKTIVFKPVVRIEGDDLWILEKYRTDGDGVYTPAQELGFSQKGDRLMGYNPTIKIEGEILVPSKEISSEAFAEYVKIVGEQEAAKRKANIAEWNRRKAEKLAKEARDRKKDCE
jgi:hypothetical protein